jgi:hypothetical protein
MLYLITLPPPLQAGVYSVSKISLHEVVQVVQEQNDIGAIASRIDYRETAEMLSTACGLIVPTRERKNGKHDLLPNLANGDRLLQSKLLPGVVAPQSIDDFEFLLIEYSE